MYKYIKRFFDIVSSFFALLVLSPLLLVLIVAGRIVMKGNPFFTQERPGKNEVIFKLIKFRTMTNEKDDDGNLLPDADRLTRYGEFLRKTSLDELPELINILKGDMSVIGPRPLLVQYLPYYTEEEKHRHDVRPGLTGWAQINGRNTVDWNVRFAYDLEYVNSISFAFDIKVLFLTIKKVLTRSDVIVDSYEIEPNLDDIRREVTR